MIAVAVSSVNHCHYCLTSHGAAVRQRAKDPEMGELMVQNYRAADLPPRQKAMLDFAVRLTEAPDKIEEADREALRKAGFNDRDIWDIAAVAAFYNMSNRMAAATDMKPNREYHYMVREQTTAEAPARPLRIGVRRRRPASRASNRPGGAAPAPSEELPTGLESATWSLPHLAGTSRWARRMRPGWHAMGRRTDGQVAGHAQHRSCHEHEGRRGQVHAGARHRRDAFGRVPQERADHRFRTRRPASAPCCCRRPTCIACSRTASPSSTCWWRACSTTWRSTGRASSSAASPTWTRRAPST